MNVQLKRYEFPRLHSNKAKLKHPNVTELLCVCVCVWAATWVGLHSSRKNSCLFQLSVTHVKWLTYSWVDVFIFKIPLQSSHIHIATTSNDNQPTMEESWCGQHSSKTVFSTESEEPSGLLWQQINIPDSAALTPWKYPYRKSHIFLFFFSIQCLYYAELCLGYANALSSPSGCDIQAQTGPPHPMVFS